MKNVTWNDVNEGAEIIGLNDGELDAVSGGNPIVYVAIRVLTSAPVRTAIKASITTLTGIGTYNAVKGATK